MSDMTEFLNELRASARQVVDGEGTAAAQSTLWPLVVELGWLLTAVPEELDGLGLGLQGSCMLHVELGRGLVQAPFASASIALDAVLNGDTADKADLLARYTAGEFATAPLADVANLSLSGTGDAATLSGSVSVVPSADNASELLVWFDDCVALIKLDQDGVERTARATWDTTRCMFDVRIDGVKLSEQTVLARGAAAAKLVKRLEVQRDFALAADAIGASSGLLDITIEHLQTREQFGRPLALFQALKHRCADLKTLLDTAESLLMDSLTRLGDDLSSSDNQLLAKKAKFIACSTFASVAEESLQLHGGIGMASEHPCHLFLKRAMLNEQLGSGNGSYELDIAEHFLAEYA